MTIFAIVMNPIAYRAIRPACSYFVKVRLDEVKVKRGVQVTEAKETPGGVELTLSDGSTSEVDHLMFGTGYRVDKRRTANYGRRHPVAASWRRPRAHRSRDGY